MLTTNTKLASVALFLFLWGSLSGLFTLWDSSPPSLLLLTIVTLSFASYITALTIIYFSHLKPVETKRNAFSA